MQVKQAMEKTMRLKILCGLMASLTFSSVFAAGFLDERAKTAPMKNVVASASLGKLSGDFALKEWDQIAPKASENGVALSLALIRLLPSNMAAVEIDAPGSIVDMPVKWSESVTRKQALNEIVNNYPLDIQFEGRSISVRPIASPVVRKTDSVADAANPNNVAKTEAKFVIDVAAPPSFELVKGKRVDDQLRAYGKRSGWDLIWQAPEYVLDQNMMIPGDFVPAVLFFLNGANEAGSRLRAVFYRGNKNVRITEF